MIKKIPFLTLWLVLVNLVSVFFWLQGIVIFSFLIISIWLCYRYLLQAQPMRLISATSISRLTIITAAQWLIILIFSLSFQPDWIMDIAANTDAAIGHFLRGDNPYTHRSQLWVDSFSKGPGIESSNGEVLMFGQRYSFGYPYFPTMLLSYLPLSALLENYTAIRLSNLLLSGLNLYLIIAMVKQFTPADTEQQIIKKLSVIVLFLTPAYLVNIYYLGITDILLSSFILACFYAGQMQRWFLAGLLLGLAQSSKLLPAPMVLLALFIWLPNLSLRLRLIAGFSISSGLSLLPFIVWDSEGFISATILYYLTHHVGGDSTSLWFFLPSSMQTWFHHLAPILTAVFILRYAYRCRGSLEQLMTVCFISYLIFIAFSKMSHFNYYWGVYPII